jgi:DNA repair protein RecO (recombination protein O)
MLVTSQGFVIHQIKYGETSSIVQIFSSNYGMIKLMINGVRGKKSKAGMLQPLNQVEVVYYRKEHQQIYTLKEMVLTRPYLHLNSDPERIAQVMFCTELIYKMVKEEEQNEDLFTFIKSSLDNYDDAVTSDADFHLHFLAGLASATGILPNQNYENDRIFFNLQNGDFQSYEDVQCLSAIDSKHIYHLFSGVPLKINNTERRTLLSAVLSYVQMQFPHVGKIQSAEILAQVFRKN